MDRAALARTHLLIIGPNNMVGDGAHVERLRSLPARLPIGLTVRFEHIPDESVGTHFEMADVVVMPYQFHVGSSGVMLLAASHGRPVVGPAFGLIGETIRRERLGIAVDTTDPAALAAALTLAIIDSSEAFSDRDSMRAFAALHHEDGFAPALFSGLGLPSGAA